jgi:uncharacterized membrane protein (DUF485 family)
MTATLEEIRELSTRSRRAQAWAALSLVITLAFFPLLALVAAARPAWLSGAVWGATIASGALFVATAYVTGQSRGAFRRVLRRVRRAASSAAREAPPR